jgi:hypothetical protein
MSTAENKQKSWKKEKGKTTNILHRKSPDNKTFQSLSSIFCTTVRQNGTKTVLKYN